uniref:Uncharacterized protein n=1 Tax=Amphimedon queenslandica TaxID=400682 RepID=A0A1X7VC17_AMPQE
NLLISSGVSLSGSRSAMPSFSRRLTCIGEKTL